MRRKSLKDIAYAVVRNEVVVVVLPPSPYSLVVVPVSRSILSFPRPSVIPINHQRCIRDQNCCNEITRKNTTALLV